MIPYTPNEETANKYKTPKFTSASTIPFPNGITAHPTIARVKVKIGAIANITVLALLAI